MSSMKEVAQRAGVSVGTVSNVLNRPDVVAEATRERVRAAIEELGFVRNEAARQLRTGRSSTIGFVVLDVANPFFTDVARGAEEGADGLGSTIMLCHSAEDPDREARHIAMLDELRVQGALISPVDNSRTTYGQLMEHGIPVVLVDRPTDARQRCSVAVDNKWGARLAIDHLLDRGHRHIAFVGGPLYIQQVADRLEGARDAVADVDGATIDVYETTSLQLTSGLRTGTELVDGDPDGRPTAAFCANDLLALGVLQAALRQGVAVPDDLAIVGYDDIDFAAAAAIPLTTVRQPRELLGRTAAQLLAEEVHERGSHTHRSVVYEPELIVRESSAEPRGR